MKTRKKAYVGLAVDIIHEGHINILKIAYQSHIKDHLREKNIPFEIKNKNFPKEGRKEEKKEREREKQ